MFKNVLITGSPGVGKTTVIKKRPITNPPIPPEIPYSPFVKGGQRGIAGFINTIKARSGVKIYTITCGNRKTIPAEIARTITMTKL